MSNSNPHLPGKLGNPDATLADKGVVVVGVEFRNAGGPAATRDFRERTRPAA